MKLITVIFYLFAISIHADMIKQIRFIKQNNKTTSYDYTVAGQAVIPQIKHFKLTGKNTFKDLEPWYKCKDFTIIKSLAVKKAKALQASGEWRKFLERGSTPTQQTKVFLAYGKKNLYIVARCYENNIAKILTEPTRKRDAAVYGADCLEIFLEPQKNNDKYFHIIVDLNKTIYDACYSINNGKKITHKKWNSKVKIASLKTEKFWQLEFLIPFESFAFKPSPGKSFIMNICRHETPNDEFSSWSPLEKSFHERDNFYQVFLTKKKNNTAFISRLTLSQPLLKQNIIVKLKNNAIKSFYGYIELTGLAKNKTFFYKKQKVKLVKKTTLNISFASLPIPASGTWQVKLIDTDNRVIDFCQSNFTRFTAMQLMLKNKVLKINDILNGTVIINSPDNYLNELSLKIELLHKNKILSNAVIKKLKQRKLDLKFNFPMLKKPGKYNIKTSLFNKADKLISSENCNFSITEDLLDF